jgi:hypothetical protein
MIKNIIMFLFITLFQFTFSQESQLVQDEEFPVFPICSLVPSSMQNICFEETISEHIANNFVYPKAAMDLELQAVVKVFFEIDKNGKVDKLFAKASLVGVKFNEKEALLEANQIFEQASIDIMNKLPLMKPGKINGEVSSFPFDIPIIYRLPSSTNDFTKVYPLDSVEWAPLFPETKNISPEESKIYFKKRIADHIKKYLRFPRKSKNLNDQVIVFVEIIVENDGNIYEITAFGNEEFRKEAERVIKKIPSLEPGLINDYPVAISYTVPITFNRKK